MKSTGYAIILGNYDTTGATRLYSGILWIDGKAEQTAGVFELRNDAIIKVDGAESALRIYDGVIAGQGAVAANLTLGYDPAIYAGMPPTAAMITPGILPIVPYARTVGTLTVTAAFQIFSGSMVIDVNAVGEFDQIVVHGNYAALAGSLFVQYDTDYKPPQQTTLPFLTFQSLIGDFSSRTWNNYAWQCPGSTIPFSWFFSTTATSYNLFSRQQMDHGKY